MSTITKKLRPVLSRDGIGVLLILILLFLVLSISSPYFLTGSNISNLLQNSVFVMIVAFGTMFVLTAGGIDLSVGSVLGLCGGTSGWLMVHGVNMWIAILAGLVLGTIIGLFNGIIITRLGISPFIATFAMLYIARGLLYLITANKSLTGFAPNQFKFFSQGYVMGIPTAVWITLIIFLLCFYLFNWTKFGRSVVSVGSNKEAAYLSGISTNNINIRVYALSGLLAAAAGIMLISLLTSVNPGLGTNYELNAIAATVIGGTSLTGGKGSVVGVVVGSIIIQLVSNGMDLLSVNQYYRLIITGLIIVIAVFADQMKSSRAD
jgi:ribose transport system permease protein